MNKKRKQFHGKPGTKSLNLIHLYFPRVAQVIDANKPAIVEVTAADNTGAEVKNPAFCAFAKACHRAFKANGVLIMLTTSYIIKNKAAVRYINTEAISREVVSFDRKAGFDLGFYKLAPSSPARRLGVYKGQKTHPRKNGKDRRVFKHYTKGVRVLGQIPDKITK